MNKTVCLKQWQVFVMLGASGFALGNILAQLTSVLGF